MYPFTDNLFIFRRRKHFFEKPQRNNVSKQVNASLSIIYEDEGLVLPTQSQTALHSCYKWGPYLSINLKNCLKYCHFLQIASTQLFKGSVGWQQPHMFTVTGTFASGHLVPTWEAASRRLKAGCGGIRVDPTPRCGGPAGAETCFNCPLGSTVKRLAKLGRKEDVPFTATCLSDSGKGRSLHGPGVSWMQVSFRNSAVDTGFGERHAEPAAAGRLTINDSNSSCSLGHV